MYYQNFYAFRFLAAMAIVVLHIHLMASRFGWSQGRISPSVKSLSLGVDFFFVLSGFLITSLIWSDLIRSRFSICRFYLRRALRILPLYYLLVSFIFFVVPVIGFPELPGMPLGRDFELQLGLHMVMLPQVAKSFLHFVPYGGQLWTIGVEIMFYLFWPLLLMIRPRLSTIMTFIILWVTLKGVWLSSFGSDHPVSQFLAMSRFEVMAIGGLAFFLFIGQEIESNGATKELYVAKLLGKHFGRGGFWLIVCVALSCISVAIWFVADDLVHLTAGAAFGALLIASCRNALTCSLLENRPMQVMGDLSYGIYLWHFIAIGFVALALNRTGLFLEGWRLWLAVYTGTLLSTLILSGTSFYLIERPINRFRFKL